MKAATENSVRSSCSCWRHGKREKTKPSCGQYEDARCRTTGNGTTQGSQFWKFIQLSTAMKHQGTAAREESMPFISLFQKNTFCRVYHKKKRHVTTNNDKQNPYKNLSDGKNEMNGIKIPETATSPRPLQNQEICTDA